MDRPRIAHVWRGVIDLIFAVVAVIALWQYLGSGIVAAAYLLVFVVVVALVFNATYRGPEPRSPMASGATPASDQGAGPEGSSTHAGPLEVGALPPRRSGSVVWTNQVALQPGGHRSQLVDLRKGERVTGKIFETTGKLDFTWAFTDLSNSARADRGQPYKAMIGGQGRASYDVDYMMSKEEQLWLELSVGERDVPRSIRVDLRRV